MNPQSKKARKQRAFSAHLDLHQQQKRLSVHTSKELRKETKKRSVSLRKGDMVKIVRGEHRGKSGKITKVSYENGKAFIEKLLAKKAGGKEAFIPIHASNLVLTELNREDDARFGKKPAKAKKTAEKTAAEKPGKTEKAGEKDIWAEETEAPATEKKVAKKVPVATEKIPIVRGEK